MATAAHMWPELLGAVSGGLLRIGSLRAGGVPNRTTKGVEPDMFARDVKDGIASQRYLSS